MRDEKESFEILLSHIGQTARKALRLMENVNHEKIREIRLIAGKPLLIVYRDKIRFIGKDGKNCGENEKAKSLTFSDIQEIFAAVCEYSVHTYNNEICRGFITTEGGNRVGICGTAVYDNGHIINIKDISALNIRVSHEIFGTADEICNKLKSDGIGGVLIAGPPCSGKTTVLRDLSRQIGSGSLGRRFHVSIVDERMEIAGVYRGAPNFDVGSTTTVLNGYVKSDGIISAVRSMAPDFVVCDEFGGNEDINASLYAMKSGVHIVASIHAINEDELLHKKGFLKTAEAGIFKWVVFMDKNCGIRKIVKTEELLK